MSDGLKHSGISFGGLGTGSVELRADGLFHEWQIMNNRPWGTGPAANCPAETSFFGLNVRTGDVSRSALLATVPAYNGWLNDPYAMPWLDFARSIDVDFRPPFADLKYEIAGLPVDVRMEAFSSFIPHDEMNSGLPLAFFTFTLRNLSDQAVEISLFQALRNLVGYNSSHEPSTMSFGHTGQTEFVIMEREMADSGASDVGSLAIGVSADHTGETSFVFHPRSRRDFWDPIRGAGRFENRDFGEFSGKIGNEGASQQARLRQGLPFGALCFTNELAAGEEEVVTFALAWHFPNFSETVYQAKNAPGGVIGHRYAEWFGDAIEVLDYGIVKFAELRKQSLTFVEAYYDTSLPRWVLDAVSAQMTTLVKSSWWDYQGRFGIWEGLGCCGLQTTDITYYGAFPIVQFFPGIEKSQMRLTRDNIEVPGKIPHLMPSTFACCDVDRKNRIDLIPQFILLVWRDILWTGDLEYAREMWPTVLDALRFFRTFDSDGDGLPNNTGPDQTYDQFPLKGTSSFVGFLYAASLRAAAEIADALNDVDSATELREELAVALLRLDSQLWTGKYYRLSHDSDTAVNNDGVMADQINGDWFVRQSAGAGLLPDDRVRSALRTVLKRCTAPQGYIANCAWSAGEGVEIGRHTADQANWPWSGVEYALSAHLILVGLEKEGLRVARDVWDRYERAGLRFNHIECGQHYYRAMSSWAVYLALTGFSMDALRQSITLRLSPKLSRFIIATPTGWAKVEAGENARTVKLWAMGGAIEIRKLVLRDAALSDVALTMDGVPVNATVAVSAGAVTITFGEAIAIRQGQQLAINA